MKIEISVRLEDGKEKVATLNATSRNLLIDHYGGNNDKWVPSQKR